MGLLDLVGKVAEKIFTNGVKVHPEIAKKRLQICKKCKHLFKSGNCGKCGCFVKFKTLYADQRCGINRW